VVGVSFSTASCRSILWTIPAPHQVFHSKKPHFLINSFTHVALSPRKKGPPPKLDTHVASAMDIKLSEVEGLAAGMRVNFTSALESMMPVKHVSGPKFSGDLSKAVFAGEEGTCMSHSMRKYVLIIVYMLYRIDCDYVRIWRLQSSSSTSVRWQGWFHLLC
jgi:hypothetical protein